MKDIAMLGKQNLRLARLATVDVIGSVRLGMLWKIGRWLIWMDCANFLTGAPVAPVKERLPNDRQSGHPRHLRV
jgi:hypothetical protein